MSAGWIVVALAWPFVLVASVLTLAHIVGKVTCRRKLARMYRGVWLENERLKAQIEDRKPRHPRDIAKTVDEIQLCGFDLLCKTDEELEEMQ